MPESSKSERREAAREELRRAQARARRRSRLGMAAGIVVAVALVAAALVAIGLHSNSPTNDATTTAAQPAVISAATRVPASAFDAVGAGGGSVQQRPRPLSAPALTSDGKPRVVYVGAEYCPYCAAERWAVVAALSRFGTFQGLGQTSSSSEDIYPSTPTLSFHGATYQSDYLSFSGTEIQSNQRQGNSYAPLDPLSPADQKLLQTYDTSQYTGASSGSIPFLDLGGHFVSSGASYDPGTLAGMTHQQVATAMSDPSSKVAKAIDGTANVLTADLCALTNQKPAAVCASAGVAAAK